jgi:tRNA (cmo5U34)-methyltransferase
MWTLVGRLRARRRKRNVDGERIDAMERVVEDLTRSQRGHADWLAGLEERWRDLERPQRRLAERDDIPTEQGYAVLVELLPPAPRRVLDLGTGDGYALALVRAARPSVDGVGLDSAAEMLVRSRARFADVEGVEIVEHDLADPLPPALGHFDLVISTYTIHHLAAPQKRRLFGEVFNVLDAGGMFLVLERVAAPSMNLWHPPPRGALDAETQLLWLREIGYTNVDCYWKWREFALLVATKPA